MLVKLDIAFVLWSLQGLCKGIKGRLTTLRMLVLFTLYVDVR